MTSGHTLQQLESEMARVRERLSTYERELQRIAEERTERVAFVAGEITELNSHEERQHGLEAEMQVAQSSLESLRQRRDEAAQLASEDAGHGGDSGRAAPRCGADRAAH